MNLMSKLHQKLSYFVEPFDKQPTFQSLQENLGENINSGGRE